MKNNQPVTGVEKDFSIESNILSTTDLKGTITYVNPEFTKISGFSEQELLNKNHNVVRHPDMPPAAYDNLWSEIKAGNPWMGIVKNRCKNGDHYWVDAYITPIVKNGNTTEYQSVRYKPERSCVERAEAIYAAISAGKKIRSSLSARLGLRNKLILANLLAMVPALLATQLESLADFGLAGFILSAVLIGLFNTVTIRPLNRLVGLSQRIFNNPLMSKIYTGRDDEFGHIQLALKMRRSETNAVVGRLSDTSQILGTSSEVTAHSANQALEGVNKQLSEITQVATAMTEMAATVTEVARNAALTAESTAAGKAQAHSGQVVVDQTIEAIERLSQEIQQASEVIQKLSEYSANIGGILAVIKGIAEQTNLLALNAAIEAARAGEQGRGFAVVADEVRTLAGRTAASTQEIETMIEHLQNGTRSAVQVMQSSRDQADHCMETAAKAGEALETITNAINNISDMNHQIATASEEQSAVAEEIQRSVVNINEVAEATSLGAEKSTDAIKETGETIRHLESLIGQFMDKRT